MAGLTVNWNDGMAGFIDSCYERYEADLRARGLVSCLPCGGSGWVYSGSPLKTIRVATRPMKCTLCNGKGITHPPPITTITIGWYDPRSRWDIGL